MKESLKSSRNDLKRLSASMAQLTEMSPKKKRRADLKKCFYCKTDAGKNFFMLYKQNQELKGKICKQCYDIFKGIKKLNI